MEWLKNRSLKQSFMVITCLFLCIGVLFAGFSVFVCVQIHTEYIETHTVHVTLDDTGEIKSYTVPGDGKAQTSADAILSALQIVLPVFWVVVSLIFANIVFYNVKLKRPLVVLQAGAEKIQRQDLNFEIEPLSSDELGQLCASFEIMRQELKKNNYEMWRQAEERKRLNAAFSHDLRNPVTVLKGSAKLLQKGVDSGSLNADNGKEPVELIYQYAGRIEHYVEIMTSAQKLEELECKRLTYNKEDIQSELQSSLTILAETSGKEIKITYSGTTKQVHIDKQFVYNTAENLISNALRYAKNKVVVEIAYQEKRMILTVCDNGNGYPATILKKGIAPFSRNEISDSEHFGMGLYICKLLCEKHGGSLTIENMEHGAKTIAVFNF